MSPEWIALIVLAGAFAQAATGVGFGIVAGPFLLLVHGYDQALVETAALSLLVSLVTAFRLAGYAQRSAMVPLCATLPVGVGIGLVALYLLPQAVILTGFGLMLVAMGTNVLRQTYTRPAAGAVHRTPMTPGRAMTLAGVLAGVGTALFAAPGPAAAWGLATARFGPMAIRGTLAAYFVVAYGAVLLTFLATGATARLDLPFTVWMMPVCATGAVLGMVLGDRLSAAMLRRLIGGVVIASGLAILVPLLLRS